MAINPQLLADTAKVEAMQQVQTSFLNAPVPDKYNDHNLDERVVALNDIEVSQEEVSAMAAQTGKKRGLLGSVVGSLTSDLTGGVVGGIDENEVAAKLLKWLNANKVATRLVAKWYNESDSLTADGSHFNYDLISERGLYDASALEVANAENVAGGFNKIMDAAAGELIPNTFVMVSVFNYLSAEEMTAIAAATASAFGGYGHIAGQVMSVAGAALKGYFVRTNTFLFRLDWTPELQTEFETTYWTAADLTDFHNSDKFRLVYVGKTSDFVPASLSVSFNDSADIKAIDRATVRAIDGAVQKLQKDYEVFKTLAPIAIQDGAVTAYVGMKEGIKGGDKFDVFEYMLNEDGTTSLHKVGTVKARKKMIWDNRYAAGEDVEADKEADADASAAQSLQYTTFDGKVDKFMDGMFIRQQK